MGARLDQSGDYIYTESGGYVTLTNFIGTGTSTTTPTTIGGNPVTTIGTQCFRYNTVLTSVTVSSGITTIGSYAFQGCTALASITIPSTVTHISEWAFSGTHISSISMPSALTYLGWRAFSGCTYLTSLSLPNGITYIGSYLAYGCTALTSVTLGNAVTSFGTNCFDGCTALATINIPSTVTTLGAYDFQGTHLTSVTIPDGVAVIPDYVFKDCVYLTTVTIGSGVTTIGNQSFYGCTALTDMYFLGLTAPTYVGSNWIYRTVLGYSVAVGHAYTDSNFPAPGNIWSYLTMGDYITRQDGDYVYNIISGQAFIVDYTGSGGNVVIPATLGGSPVVSIGNYAMSNITALTSVTIPSNITTIGAGAFYGCSNLVSITFLGLTAPTSVGTNWVTGCNANIRGHAYVASNFPTPGNYFTGLLMGAYISDIFGDFRYAIVAGTATITGYIGTNSTLIIPSTINGYTVTTIGYESFSSSTYPTSVTIPNTITTIEGRAFYGCSNLVNITFLGLTAPTSVGADWISECNANIRGHAYADSNFPSYLPAYWNGLMMGVPMGHHYDYVNCTGGIRITHYNGEGGDLVIPSTIDGYDVVEIGRLAFFNNGLDVLTSVVIPDGVTYIDEYAFGQCYIMTSMVIPDSVTYLGNWSFAHCDSLTNITIPSGVISRYAFSSCDALTSVVIGDSVTYIGRKAFEYCDALTSVVIGDNVTYIDEAAFSFCDALTSVVIPDSVTYIGDYAFSFCEALTSVVIGDNVTYIDEAAFFSCEALTSVVIPDNVTYIGNYTFEYCDALTSVVIGDSVTYIGEAAFTYCYNLVNITFLGLTAPTSVGADWISECNASLVGHAYAYSNFPTPGNYFYGLLMGSYL